MLYRMAWTALVWGRGTREGRQRAGGQGAGEDAYAEDGPSQVLSFLPPVLSQSHRTT